MDQDKTPILDTALGKLEQAILLQWPDYNISKAFVDKHDDDVLRALMTTIEETIFRAAGFREEALRANYQNRIDFCTLEAGRLEERVLFLILAFDSAKLWRELRKGRKA